VYRITCEFIVIKSVDFSHFLKRTALFVFALEIKEIFDRIYTHISQSIKLKKQKPFEKLFWFS
jgi:hypothetical protein